MAQSKRHQQAVDSLVAYFVEVGCISNFFSSGLTSVYCRSTDAQMTLKCLLVFLWCVIVMV